MSPSIALIVATTMIPTGFRHPSFTYIDYAFNLADFINNLLLYVPLGLALSGSSLMRTGLFSLLLSTCAELLQIGYVNRIPSPLDVASNTCGAMIGFLAAMFWLRATGYRMTSLIVPRRVGILAIAIAIFGSWMLVRHRPVSDFSNWDPSYKLAIGNELTGDRPWTGTIYRLAIYSFAMTPSEIDGIAHSAGLTKASGEPPAVDRESPIDSKMGNVSRLLSPPEEFRLYQELVKRNQLTLLISMRTNNLEQGGPARIVTYSQDALNRNFTLGQIQNTLTFRLRTPASGSNGMNPALYSGPVLSQNRTFFIAAVYDGRLSKLYVDGKTVAQADLAARRPHLPGRVFRWLPRSLPIPEIEQSASEILLAGLLALGIFALREPAGGWLMRVVIGALAGAAVGGTVWVAGVSEASLGIRILLECVAAGVVVTTSLDATAH